MKWTAEKTDTLQTMLKSGFSSRADIAKILGTTRSAVAGKVARLNGYKRPEDAPREPSRRKLTRHARGDWDDRTTEPYEIRKARLAEEKSMSSSLHLQPKAYQPPPKAMRAGPWDEGESANLKNYRKAGLTPEQCATKLRRPIKGILTRAIALGVPFTQKED